jgi:DNA-binding response OmpR family regulator
LAALARAPDKIVTHDRLAKLVWGYPDARTAPGLSVHVQRLRQKLSSASPKAPGIAAVRGKGYMLVSHGVRVSSSRAVQASTTRGTACGL